MMNTDWGHGGADPQGLTLDFPRAVGVADQAAALLHLRRGLGGLRPVERCTLLKLRYLPGRLLQAIYRIGAAGTADDIVTVDFLREDEATASCGGVVLADWNARLRVFPDDPQLPQLPHLLDAGAVSARLAPFARTPIDPGQLSWSLLSYQPGDRCALRYRWPAAGLDAVGKLQSGAAASHLALLRLWELPGRGFRMPQPLLCDELLAVRWERFVPARRFDEVAAESGLDAALAAVVRGLVDLHGTPLPDLPVQDRPRLLGRIERKVMPRIRGALPAIAGECEALVGELACAAANLPPPLPVTVHGDLHTGNILLDGSGLVLIDLDSLARGEPAFDLALLGTRLLLLGLLGEELPRYTATAVARLPLTYRGAGGDEISEQVFAWYVAALLVGRQLKTSINHLAPGMAGLASQLLATARAVLAAGRVAADTLPTPR